MLKILIVDDEIYSIEALECLLDWEAYGIEKPDRALNAKEAMEKLAYPYDIVICDIRMPGKSGLELLEEARSNFSLMPASWIFLSAYSEFSYVQKAMSLGASGYLLKPVGREQLQEIIQDTIAKISDLEDYYQYRQSVNRAHADLIDEFWDRYFHAKENELSGLVGQYRQKGLRLDPDRRYLPVVFRVMDDRKLSQMFAIALRYEMSRTVFGHEGHAVLIAKDNLIFGLFHNFRYQELTKDMVMEECDRFLDRLRGQYEIEMIYEIGSEVPVEQVKTECLRIETAVKCRTSAPISLFQEPSAEKDLIATVKEFIEAHLSDSLNRELIAGEAHFNPDYLGKLFRQQTGRT